ncbi:unnamed protein product [Moneuplotes crassus]|uniref:Uncharacterized protein n=2 Tax=Euplotes crassus TaxID=5936 RepID=A0AAD2DAB6_EUPCR|nr:unnamed protein product [Moneuplotes crassus]
MMNEANGNHNVARRSQIQQDLRRSSEDGSYILNQESNGKSAIRGLKYHYKPVQSSKIAKSPSKFHKRLQHMEKKKEKWNNALKREKEYLYDEALRFKKEKNSKTTENRKLGARVRYLEKEVKKRDSMIQELMQKPLQYPAYTSPNTQSKQTMEALQRSIESNIVINLKKLIEDQKSEIISKDELIKSLKMDMKGSHFREIHAEKKAFEEEAIRLRGMIDNFISQIGGADQVLNIRAYIDDQQEMINNLEGQKSSQEQIYEAKYEECCKLEKKLTQAELDKENARKDIKQLKNVLHQKDGEYHDLEIDKKKTVKSYESKIKAINKVLTDREQEIDRLTSVLEERDQEIRGNEQQIRLLETEVSDLQKQLENRDSIISAKEYDIQDLKNKISQLENELQETIKGYKDQLQAQKDRFESAADAQQAEHQQVVSSLKSDHQQAEATLKGQISSLEGQIVDMVNEKNDILSKNQDSEEKYKKDIKQLEDDIDELQGKLKAFQLEIKKIEDKNHKINELLTQESKRSKQVEKNLKQKIKQLTLELQKRPPAEDSEQSFDNGEFNDRTGIKSELKSKILGKKESPSDGKNGTGKIESLSNNSQHLKPKEKTVKSRKKHSDSEGDLSLFERDDRGEDLLENHLGRPEREKAVHKDSDDDYDEVFHPELSDSDDDRVMPVQREEIVPMAKKILEYCNENDVDIMDLPNFLFVDFSLTGKVSVATLSKTLGDKFNFDAKESVKLARYMVEQPENFNNSDDGEKGGSRYEFNPERQLSHAKVVSKLQTVISSLT